MADYTTTGLLAAVRRYGQLPSYDEGAATTLLALLNAEQLTYLTKQLEATREEYRTATLDITLTASRLTYPVPTRAIASGIVMLQVVDAAGSEWGLHELRPYDFRGNNIWTSPCKRFYLKRNEVVFYAQPPTGTLRVWYPLRFSELVAVDAASANYATISSITVATKTVVVDHSLGLTSYDFVQANPQFDALALDEAATGTTTLVFTNELPAALAVGDYVCKPGRAPVCTAPLELHSLLCMHVAHVAQLMKGDPKAGATKQLRDETAKDVLTLLEPRPKRARPIINFAAPGWRRWAGWAAPGRGE